MKEKDSLRQGCLLGGKARGLIMQMTSFFFGGWLGPTWQPPLVLTEKFLTDQLRLRFWARLKLQLDYALGINLGTLSDTIWGLFSFFLNYCHVLLVEFFGIFSLHWINLD